MKKSALKFAAVAVVGLAFAAHGSETVSRAEDVAKRIPQETAEETAARMKWWQHDRFGMFIHFGIYAQAARHEKVKSREHMTDEQYEPYCRRFDPALFDATEWARTARPVGVVPDVSRFMGLFRRRADRARRFRRVGEGTPGRHGGVDEAQCAFDLRLHGGAGRMGPSGSANQVWPRERGLSPRRR